MALEQLAEALEQLADGRGRTWNRNAFLQARCLPVERVLERRQQLHAPGRFAASLSPIGAVLQGGECALDAPCEPRLSLALISFWLL